jgi:hypothetical protein
MGIAKLGNLLYVGRSIFDITDPRNPVFKADLPGYSLGMAVGPNNRLFTSAHGSSPIISIYDTSTPLAPKLVATLLTGPQDLLPNGDFLYVAAGMEGLLTIQVAGQVQNVPRLQVATFGEKHHLRWTPKFDDLNLLTAPTPIGPWTTATHPIYTNYYGLYKEVVLPSRTPGTFYRLGPLNVP